MAITKDDREIIRLIANEVANEVASKFAESQRETMSMMISHHQETCPHGRKLLESKWFLAGVCCVVVILTAGGSALGTMLMKIL